MFVRFSVMPSRATASAWENAHRERHIAVDRIASRWKLDSHSLHTRWHPHWHHVSRPRHALHVQHERVAGEPLAAEFERPRALAPPRTRRLEEDLPSRGVAHHDLRAFAERDGA